MPPVTASVVVARTFSPLRDASPLRASLPEPARVSSGADVSACGTETGGPGSGAGVCATAGDASSNAPDIRERSDHARVAEHIRGAEVCIRNAGIDERRSCQRSPPSVELKIRGVNAARLDHGDDAGGAGAPGDRATDVRADVRTAEFLRVTSSGVGVPGGGALLKKSECAARSVAPRNTEFVMQPAECPQAVESGGDVDRSRRVGGRGHAAQARPHERRLERCDQDCSTFRRAVVDVDVGEARDLFEPHAVARVLTGPRVGDDAHALDDRWRFSRWRDARVDAIGVDTSDGGRVDGDVAHDPSPVEIDHGLVEARVADGEDRSLGPRLALQDATPDNLNVRGRECSLAGTEVCGVVPPREQRELLCRTEGSAAAGRW